MLKGIVALALLLAGPAVTATSPAIRATDAATGRVILCRPFPGTGEATLVFTHSMYGGAVAETFAPTRDSRLRRVAITTANAAAAEYYAYDGAVTAVGDRYRVDAPAAAFAEIAVRVDRVGGHRLRVGGDAFDLVALAGDRRRVVLDVAGVGIVDRLRGGSGSC